MIKPLNISELEDLAESLRAWEGAVLQSQAGSDKTLALQFQKNDVSAWLWVDIGVPVAVLADRCPPINKRKKPVNLFIEANLVGKKLEKVELLAEEGRVLHLFFEAEGVGEGEGGEVELRLFPHGKNIIVCWQNKKVSALKVKPLLKAQVEEGESSGKSFREKRSSEEILQEVWVTKKKKGRGGQDLEELQKKAKKDLKKKRGALEKLCNKLAEKEEEQWLRAAEYLKEKGNLQILPDWILDFIDQRESYAWNLQRGFEQVKKIRGKQKGRVEQMTQLKEEIAFLEKSLADPVQLKKISASKKPAVDMMKKAQVKGRRRELAPGMRINMGKSAKDNVSLLRRAKAWYLWFHLRDFPGSHAILELNRGQKLPSNFIETVGQWLIAESLGDRAVEGELYTVIWTECRYVQPIKGDRLGRVHYQNESSREIRYVK